MPPRGIAQSVYYKWEKNFMDVGKRWLDGYTARADNADEMRAFAADPDLKEVAAEQLLEMRLLQKA
jgi:transposase